MYISVTLSFHLIEERSEVHYDKIFVPASYNNYDQHWLNLYLLEGLITLEIMKTLFIYKCDANII